MMYSYDRRVGSEAISKGAELVVVMRKGQWPSDMFNKGSVLTVTDGGGLGETIWLKIKGQVMGGPYDFKVASVKDGTYTLESVNDRFKRGLKVKLRNESKTAAAPKWDKTKTKRWMEQNVKDYVDRKTDEVDATGLAEAAANEFNIYENQQDYDIPEEVFDLAVDVSTAWERKNKR